MTTHRMRQLAVMLVVSVPLVANCADKEKKAAADKLERAFRRVDQEKNERISKKEFVESRPKMAKVAERDFLLFDFDSDGSLNLDEFSTAVSLARPDERGTVPDPLHELVDQAVFAMDKSFQDWDKNPEREIDANQFIGAFVATLGSNTTRPSVREADHNGDRKVSRKEARRFMEIQLGVRRGDGALLRRPNGRVVNLMLFQHLDGNKSGKLERAEFLERTYVKDKPEELFDKSNKDDDDAISFDEWWDFPHRGAYDVVLEFRRFDTNHDAYIDAKELKANTPEWKQSMAANVFPGFDTDIDGKLTLAEYRLTMLANPLLKWHRIIRDPDGDMELSFNEFKFDTLQFPLLRLIYFHHLDVNSDKMLDTSEFVFKTKTPNEFFVLNEDGTGWRSFFRFEGYPACGSPAVSSDGKRIAFDAWSIKPRTSSTMFVMSIDGTDAKKVGPGMMPNWSKDAKLLACSRSGARIVKVDGGEHKMVNQAGWGAQWSPGGKRLIVVSGDF